MLHDDNANPDGFNPDHPDVWSQDHHMPFANRTVTWVFTLIGIVLLGALAVLLPFSSTENPPRQQGDTSILVNVDPSTGEEVGFLAKIFNDMTQGIKTNLPHVDTPIETFVRMEDMFNDMEDYNDDYNFSFRDTLDSEIIGARGKRVGTLYDILVNRGTGEAKAIIISEEDQYYDQKLVNLRFQKIRYQEPDGDTLINVTEEQIDQRKNFDYTRYDKDTYVSLKNLRNGQIVDDHGEYVGEIDGLIYQNEEVQDVYFFVKQSLTPLGQARLFNVPFESVNLVEGPGGFDIKLSKEETRALARALYSNKGDGMN